MYVLAWRAVYALTRGLFWCLFPQLRSKEGKTRNQYVVHHNPVPRLISTSNTLGGNHSTVNLTINPPITHSTIDQSPEYRKLSVENNPQRDIIYDGINEKCIFLQVTLRWRYNAVNFHQYLHKRHPIARPLVRGLLWISSLIHVLLL